MGNLDEIKARNQKSSYFIYIAIVITGVLALMFFRCYTA
jgi:hypothetical protein